VDLNFAYTEAVPETYLGCWAMWPGIGEGRRLENITEALVLTSMVGAIEQAIVPQECNEYGENRHGARMGKASSTPCARHLRL
jgi:hypothetical protein